MKQVLHTLKNKVAPGLFWFSLHSVESEQVVVREDVFNLRRPGETRGHTFSICLTEKFGALEFTNSFPVLDGCLDSVDIDRYHAKFKKHPQRVGGLANPKKLFTEAKIKLLDGVVFGLLEAAPKVTAV